MIGRILSLGIPSGVENSMFQLGKLSIQSSVSTLGTISHRSPGNDKHPRKPKRNRRHRRRNRSDDRSRPMPWSRQKRRSHLLHKKTQYHCGNHHHRKLPPGICPDHSDNKTRWNGTPKRSDVLPHGNLDHHRQTNRMGNGLRPCLRPQAAGDVKFSMLTSCITMWAFRFCLCVYLIRFRGFGPMAVWIGMFTDWTVRGIVFSLRFHSRKWLNHKVV